MFLINSPIEFVKQHTDQLEECNCLLLKREKTNNVRDFMDLYVAHSLDEQNWPKDKPIRILDIGSGGLMQVATTMTSLANKGYLVELILIDENIHSKSEKIQSLLDLFNEINKITKKPSIQLVGQFSCVDSYLATIHGKPLQFMEVKANEISRYTKEGIKRRYLVPHFGKHVESNVLFRKEFESSVAACGQKAPNIVLLVDDITEFHPDGVPFERGDERGGFSFEFEVLQPFQRLDPNTVILGTRKGHKNLRVETYHQANDFEPSVVYEYNQQGEEYVVVTAPRDVVDIVRSEQLHIEKKTSLSQHVTMPAPIPIRPRAHYQTIEMFRAEAAFEQVLGTLFELYQEIQEDPTRQVVAEKIRTLHHALQRESHDFFQPEQLLSHEALAIKQNEFISSCQQLIQACEQEMKPELSIWERTNPVFRKILGVLLFIPAMLTIAISPISYEGYTKTFFKQTAIEQLKEVDDQVQTLSTIQLHGQ